jgi:hypothetical protein
MVRGPTEVLAAATTLRNATIPRNHGGTAADWTIMTFGRIGLVVVLLASPACSSAEESSNPTAPAVAATGGQESGSSPVACADAGAAPDGMTRALSPVEHCTGGYLAEVYPTSRSEEYLHSDGATCLLGRAQILHADGRVTQPPGFADLEGTWKGDVVYFEVKLGSTTTRYSPLPAMP